MIIADIYKDQKSNGNIIILQKPIEGQKIIEALEYFCKHNKRQVIARKILKRFNADLSCF